MLLALSLSHSGCSSCRRTLTESADMKENQLHIRHTGNLFQLRPTSGDGAFGAASKTLTSAIGIRHSACTQYKNICMHECTLGIHLKRFQHIRSIRYRCFKRNLTIHNKTKKKTSIRQQNKKKNSKNVKQKWKLRRKSMRRVNPRRQLEFNSSK